MRSKGLRIGGAILNILLLGLVSCVAGAGAARGAQLEERYHRYRELTEEAIGGVVTPHWLSDGNTFWYTTGSPGHLTIWTVAETGEKVPLIKDAARVRTQVEKILGQALPGPGLPFATVDYREKVGVVEFSAGGRRFQLELDGQSVTILADADRPVVAHLEQEVVSSDGHFSVGMKNHNLWARSVKDGTTIALTTDGTEVSRWELGPGYAAPVAIWSPDSQQIAVSRADYRGVPRVPIVSYLEPPGKNEWIYFETPESPRHRVELFVINPRTKHRVRAELPSGEYSYHYLAWSRDGSELLFTRSPRDFKRLDLIAVDPETGSTRTILTERQDTNIRVQGWNKFFTAIGDGNTFLWLSERDGWQHIYLYESDGILKRKLTHGNFTVEQVVTVDETAGWIYFTATETVPSSTNQPYHTQLYRIRMDGQSQTKLTEMSGHHTIAFSPSKRYYVDVHSSTTRPPSSELRRADGTLVSTLAEADRDLLTELAWPPPQHFSVKGADGDTDVLGVFYRPHDLKENCKYPVIEIILAGPWNTIVPNRFASGIALYAQALAQHGFVVVLMDSRGAPLRGRKFRELVYANVGRYEIPDHAAALRALEKRYPFVDISRVGVFGISYGGYMAVRALLLAPEVYKVGVAVSPISDMKHHPGNEKILGALRDNRGVYEYASNLNLAAQLKGKLLVIHGTSDSAVPFFHTMRFLNALTRADKQYDLIVLPEQGHVPSGDYWLDAVRRHFVENLTSLKEGETRE